MRLPSGVFLLPPLLVAGCTSAPATNRVTAVVPYVEKLDVHTCANHPEAINHTLSDRAENYACASGQSSQASVWYGEGLSMEPLLKSGSWIVSQPLPYSELKEGMVVLYVTHQGRCVAHALIKKTVRGWMAAGVNNEWSDSEFVTATNLAGVITAAFEPTDGP